MGQCDLCGESAGLFKGRHSACEAKAEVLKQQLRGLVNDRTLSGKPFDEIQGEVTAKILESRLSAGYFAETMLTAANDAATQIALKAPIPAAELDRLYNILTGFGYPNGNRDEMLSHKYFSLPFCGMSHCIWGVQNGCPPPFDGDGRLGFNLQRGEQPIFSAEAVTLAEEQTVNTGYRGYGGLSVPIGGGAYYHFGGSQLERVSGLMPIDGGKMLITSHSLYFGGQRTTMRIPLAHVLRYQPYIDAVGVCEAYGPPKVFIPDYSGMETGWFFSNLLSSLTARLQQ